MNRKAQTDIMTFVGIAISFFILAIFILYMTNQILTPFQAQINNISTDAGSNVEYVQDTMITFWDYVIAMAFLVNVLMLFIFAFLVDTNPIFVIFYLMVASFTLIFAHYAMTPVTTIFGMSTFSTEVGQLPITDFIVTWFDLILLAIIVLTGIITYSKFTNVGFQR